MKKLVIVESPTKASTIGKLLGKDYHILASYGHVRSIPSKSGAIVPENGFQAEYEVIPSAKKNIKALADSAKEVQQIYVATDPDREGEGIAWHIVEILKSKRGVIKNDTQIHRVTYHEITKNAIQYAFQNPRELDMNLIRAQQTRQSLDYLVGFTLSPLLWRKLPGSRSAGRVQSVALRIVCDREDEIEKFEKQEYWSIHGTFKNEDKVLDAQLNEFENTKLAKFSITQEKEALNTKEKLLTLEYHVSSIEKSQFTQNPKPPFITSTLQQEAMGKLGFGTKQTMIIAQKLYENGLITYMRTDSVMLSDQAIVSIRQHIKTNFGDKYIPKSKRIYKSKIKNAQEAHEAIRPSDINKLPTELHGIPQEQIKLYALIWQRAVACQMSSAIFDRTSIYISSKDRSIVFKATGAQIKFDGYLKALSKNIKEMDNILPDFKEHEQLNVSDIAANQHFTQPPPRYNEASLIKTLEELGIGRPSTYAPIISVLQDRSYVKSEQKRLFPEEKGRIVTTFLKLYFAKYVEYDFTANFENVLDLIASGEENWQDALSTFWTPFNDQVQATYEIPIQDVIERLGQEISDRIFQNQDTKCPTCKSGDLKFNLGKYGPFVGCSNYPECKHIRNIGSSENNDNDNEQFPKILGNCPITSKVVGIYKGPYGLYLQIGDKKNPVKRNTLPKTLSCESISLNQALQVLALPKTIGTLDEESIIIKATQYGFWLLHKTLKIKLQTLDIANSLTQESAIKILTEYSTKAPKKTKKKDKS